MVTEPQGNTQFAQRLSTASALPKTMPLQSIHVENACCFFHLTLLFLTLWFCAWNHFINFKSPFFWFWFRINWKCSFYSREENPSFSTYGKVHSQRECTIALVGARTDSTTRLQLQREAWPISAHAYWHSSQDSTRRGFCTLVLFIVSLIVL